MGKKSNKRKRKEEIAEDCCFICKDGGNMRVCDFGDCLKAYHPECVDKDNTFLKNDSNWCCGSHYCYICRKASKFMCFCCPAAVCGKCFFDGEFATVKRNKGFCRHCAKLASLLEKKADVDSDGEKIDFEDQETYECYFQEYYKFIKKKEGLNSQNAHFAHDFIKNGKNKCDLDPYEIVEEEDDSGESDVSDSQASDYDDLNETSGVKSVRRKKKCMKKLKSIKGKVGDKKKDFVGWGSRSLIDFLEDIGRDTAKELSEHDVASIIIEYCNSNKLFDPEKKRKVICDEKLRTLLRRKSVNKNNIQNLLTSHFVENLEETDDIICGSEERDYNEPIKFSRSRNLNPTTKSCQNLVSKELPSGFAAIISSNLKLVYLKRSLIEELLKKPDAFDGKVLGSFVRTKSDPNDYLQKNSHLLLPVIGINRSSKKEEINQEIMLRLLNVPKDVPICKISDDDFSEEECQDLYQRMRNGLLKQPTILELEQKAKTLHEDIIKHWISRELTLLRNRIDLANEKGWRRELAQYMDRKLKLESPSEQSRLLSEIPKVIPEMVYTNMSPKDSSSKDKLDQNDLPELATGDTCNSKYGGFDQCMDKRTDVIGPKTPVKNNHDDTTYPTSVEQLFVYGASQDKDTSQNELIQYTSKRRDDHLSVADPVKATVNDVVVADPVKVTINDVVEADPVKAVVSYVVEADPVKAVVSYVVEATVNDVIVLSDSDEEDVSIKNTPAGQKSVENPDVSFWNCSGVYYGETRGPFSMSVLKSWSDSAPFPLEFKVWKTGESEREAIPLRDALRLFFP